MKQKNPRRLRLLRETVRKLTPAELTRAAGGRRPITRSCLSGCQDTTLIC